MTIVGWVAKRYGDDINTDYIIPAYLLQESWDKQFFADHAFESYDPTFVQRLRAKQSSIVVAGKNFGCGSSREQAVYAIKYNGVVAVIAESFPDIFFRNCLNNGLPPVQIDDTSRLSEGDKLEIDLGGRRLINLTSNESYAIRATDESIRQMLEGGFLEYVRGRLRQKLNAKT